MGGENIQIVHYFGHGYLEEEKSIIHGFTVTFGATYLTGMVTSVPPSETFRPNFDKIVIGWSSSKIVSGDPTL